MFATCFSRFSVLLCLLFTFCTFSTLAYAADMPGLGGNDEPAKKDTSMPADVETALDALFSAVKGAPAPEQRVLNPLLNFAQSKTLPAKVTTGKREYGTGGFVRETFNAPFDKFLRYCYDPNIPNEVMYPTSLRRSQWLPESQMIAEKVKLWEKTDAMKQNAAPFVVRGSEFEEITPDAFSGCFYSYTLDRLIMLLNYEGKKTLVTVTYQRAPSSVGRVGTIVGKDNQWNYVYSNTVGSNITLAKWAETYMYSAASIGILYELEPGSARTGLALFKYVKAGWANMNMVKNSHILQGGKRFFDGLRQVIESPKLPAPEAVVAQVKKFREMDEAALRAAFAPYANALAALVEEKPLSASPFKDLVKDGAYPTHLKKNELVSELTKLYIKEQLGMPVLPQPSKK